MSKQQHVVAVPLPAQGCLNPLMRLCKVVASQGVLVTFVNQLIDGKASLKKKTKKQEDEEEEEEEEEGNMLTSVHIPLQAGPDLLANDFRMSFQHLLEAQSSLAPPLHHYLLLNRPPATCLISDLCLTIPTQDLAHTLNIPRIVFFPGSASRLLLSYYATQGDTISTTKVLEALSRREERREVVCEGLPGLPTIHNDELPHFKHVVDDTSFVWEFTGKACQESFARANALAINTFEELEAPALMALSQLLSLPVYGVGPLLESLHKEKSTSLWKEDEASILWLDQQPPLSVFYISFGSITILTQPQFEEIVAGLLSSEQRFLLVFRPGLVENVDNSSTCISDILSRSHGKGYVVDWAPQLQVLSHPSVGGFLTHCGWNSTMEAIAHGMPMCCWPYFADQLLNAKYVVEEWKVGLQFEASQKGGHFVERDEVERVIKALMQGEVGTVLRKNAMCLKEAGSQSLLPGGTSHNNIQSLIKSFM